MKRFKWQNFFMILPFLLIFVVFLFIPFIYSFIVSFHKIDGFSINSLKFIGLENYKQILKDVNFWWGLLASFIYGICLLIFNLVFSLLLGYALFKITKFKDLYRAVLFFPNLIDLLVFSLVWTILLSDGGLVDKILSNLHLHTGSLLADKLLVFPTIAFIISLKGIGFFAVIVYAVLSNIDKSMIEAARIDGADEWIVFKSIMLPNLKPTIAFIIFSTILGAFNAFTEIYALTSGGPPIMFNSQAVGETSVIGYWLFKLWENTFFGKAAAVSYILLVITILLSTSLKRLLNEE